MWHSFVVRPSMLLLAGSVWAAVAADPIVLNGIDIKTPHNAGRLDSVPKADTSAMVLCVVQFEGPTRPEWLATLESLGATVHHYVADFAYLVAIPSSSIDAAKRAGGLVWMGGLPASAKIAMGLRENVAEAEAQKTLGAKRKLIVLSYGDAAAVAMESAGMRIDAHRTTQMGWHETRFEAPLSRVSDIADIDSVFYVEEAPVETRGGERAAQTAAGQYDAGAAAPFGPGYATWLGAQGLNGGDGLIIHVVDDGLDQGIATNLPGTAHADILGRIVGIYNATSDPDGASRAGHGQIDAAIIMGNATVGTVDKGGFLLGQGLAPQASVYATKIFPDAGNSADIGTHTYTELTQLGQNAGAVFSTNSWGSAVAGAYTARSAEFDALVRDADPNEAGNQQTVHLFCAGNDGPGTGTIWAPATAKNVLSVGSHENSDADGYDGAGFGPAEANNIRDLVFSSSRGPTADGRLGVTVVATGTHVQGAAPTVAGYTGFAVSDKYWPPNQSDYARSSGTSHATPVVSGAALVIYEMFRDQLSAFGHPSAPSPALIRAVLTNTAIDLVGGSDGNGGTLEHIPNVRQGWGAVNLATLAELKTALFSMDQTHLLTASGQTFEVTLSPMLADRPMKITLAWTDVPGVPGAGTELVNDLDLRVIQDGQTYKGNVFANGFSTTGGNADRKNTLEAVYLEHPSGGPVTVRVTAFNIAGDGVPNAGGGLDQDFALFAWNAGEPDSTGNVRVFPADIRCDTAVSINLRDQDLAGDGSASVDVASSTGDLETVVLSETGPSTGLFSGAIDTAAGVPATNGVLEVVDNGSVTVTYDDVSNGNGQPAVDEDAALVDCTPPSVSNVQVMNVTSTSALITYSTNGPCDTKVRFGTTCGALAQYRGGGLRAVEHRAHLTGLTESTTYRFKIDATDPAGNSVVADDSGACFTFATTARPDYFTELFRLDDNDLANQTLLFTPNGSVSYYGVCRTAATTFPTDASAHTNLSSTVGLKGDNSYEIALADGKEFPFYGTNYTGFYINANGNISFGAPDGSAIEVVQYHDYLPRIAGLFDDLAPTNQKPIRYAQLADRAVVTWDRVPEQGVSNTNSFQIELFFDGRIRLTHLGIDASDGLVGLSEGEGTQTDWAESDMSAYPVCGTVQTGSVRVRIKPKEAREAGARWRVDGGTWMKSGRPVAGLSPGQHLIEFKSISGWQKPSDKTANVTAGQETLLSGRYQLERIAE